MNKEGKIIAVVGAPRSGKSFLAQKIALYYKTRVFLEGEEEDFPKRILEDIQLNIRPLERILWFRNKITHNYFKALHDKRQGRTVVLDTCWLDTRPYNDILVSGFERTVLNDLFRTDAHLLPWPDTVIYLKNSMDRTRTFQKVGKREFDAGELFFKEQIRPLMESYEKYFSQKNMQSRIVTIDRTNLDFSKRKDFMTIIQTIEK